MQGAEVKQGNLTINDIEDFAQRACVQLCPELTQQCLSIVIELLSYKQREASGVLKEVPKGSVVITEEQLRILVNNPSKVISLEDIDILAKPILSELMENKK